jgi:single-strand DNA-binding protein
MYINKAMVFGNLARDPELRSTPNGVQVCTFAIATNRVFNDRDGKRQESTDFHNIVVFGRQAENTNKYLKKGNSAYVEGRIQTRSYEKDGQKQYRTEIVADTVQFGPKSGQGGGAATGENASGPSAERGSSGSAGAADKKAPAVPEYPEEEINPEDIPF